MQKNIIGRQPILLPKNCDMTSWAVIACDQYTTNRAYWDKLDENIGDNPSALRITFPEIFLKDNDIERRIQAINDTMESYLKSDIFRSVDGMVLVERTLSGGKKRIGLVTCLDLDSYEYKPIAAPIRATERTITERLPVRMKIREKASIELPHILVLIDDAKKEIIEPLYDNRTPFEKLYDFQLNMNGGRIAAYKIPFSACPIDGFYGLLDEDVQKEKYGVNAGLLFAVGDGNHSMATAKEHWNIIKQTLTEKERENHPARYVLAEVVNLYQDSMDFEPIHRVVTGCDENDFIEKLSEKLDGKSSLTLLTAKGERKIACPEAAEETIAIVQNFLLSYAEETGAKIEYEHAESQVRGLSQKEKTVGILMPPFDKSHLFNYVIHNGNLPQKAFSIGVEDDKKYYIEAKRIVL